MQSNQQLADRLEEVLLSGKWIANTNWKNEITQTDFATAANCSGHHNSIAALTFHISYYLKGMTDFFETGSLTISDRFSFDMKPLVVSADWERLSHTFLHNAVMFIAHVRSMPDGSMKDSFADERYGTYYRNIEGMIEHAYYHLGQVVLLRKMMMK